MRYIYLILFFWGLVACQNTKEYANNNSKPEGVMILPNTNTRTVVTITDLDSKGYLDPPSDLPLPLTMGEWSDVQKHKYNEKIKAKASYHSPSDTVFKITVILDGSRITVKQMNSIINFTDSMVNKHYPRFKMVAVDLLLQDVKD